MTTVSLKGINYNILNKELDKSGKFSWVVLKKLNGKKEFIAYQYTNGTFSTIFSPYFHK